MNKDVFNHLLKLYTHRELNASGKIKKGVKSKKFTDDDYRLSAEKPMPCDRCSAVTINRHKHIKIAKDAKHRSFLVEKCLTCGEKFTISRRF